GNRHLGADQHVHQGRLADVRAADNGDVAAAEVFRRAGSIDDVGAVVVHVGAHADLLPCSVGPVPSDWTVPMPASLSWAARGLLLREAGALAIAPWAASSARRAAACSPARRLPPRPKTCTFSLGTRHSTSNSWL